MATACEDSTTKTTATTNNNPYNSNANNSLKKIVYLVLSFSLVFFWGLSEMFALVFLRRSTKTPHQSPEADPGVADRQQGAVPVVSSQAYDALPSKSMLTPARQEEPQIVYLRDKSIDGQVMMNNVNSRVLEGDIASPAKLAKAYVGHRPLKAGPVAQGLRIKALRVDSTLLSILPVVGKKGKSILAGPSKSPLLLHVPKSATHKGVHDNIYTTPRSPGRFAMHRMVGTPCSRARQSATFKNASPSAMNYGGLSLAAQAWDHNGPPGLKDLRRSIAVLEECLGSFGPIQRICQKPNLPSQRSWSLAASKEEQQPSSTQKLPSLDALKKNCTNRLTKGGKTNIFGRNMVSFSSKSTKMASGILGLPVNMVSSQNDKLLELKIAAIKDKEPARLLPSKLREQALRSLKHIDSSKFLDVAHDSSLDGLSNKPLHETGESSPKRKEKFEANCPSMLFTASGTPPTLNGFISKEDSVSNGSMVLGSQPPSEKKSALGTNVAEDFLNLDDDGIANEIASTISSNETEKQKAPVLEAKKVAARTIDELARHEEKAHEGLPFKSVLSPPRKEELQIVPLQDDSIDARIMMKNVNSWDFLDLVDDGIANEVAYTISSNEIEKQETPVLEAKKVEARVIAELVGYKEKAHEDLSSKLVLSLARQEEPQIVPLQDESTDGQIIINNVNSRGLERSWSLAASEERQEPSPTKKQKLLCLGAPMQKYTNELTKDENTDVAKLCAFSETPPMVNVFLSEKDSLSNGSMVTAIHPQSLGFMVLDDSIGSSPMVLDDSMGSSPRELEYSIESSPMELDSMGPSPLELEDFMGSSPTELDNWMRLQMGSQMDLDDAMRLQMGSQMDVAMEPQKKPLQCSGKKQRR